jgi:hypothetical protein
VRVASWRYGLRFLLSLVTTARFGALDDGRLSGAFRLWGSELTNLCNGLRGLRVVGRPFPQLESNSFTWFVSKWPNPTRRARNSVPPY